MRAGLRQGRDRLAAPAAPATLHAMLDHLVATLPLLLKLPGDVADGCIRQVFPVYYRAFAALSALAGLAAWGRLDAIALGAVAAAGLFASLWLMPRINAASNASRGDHAAAARFGRLHRLSGLVNCPADGRGPGGVHLARGLSHGASSVL